jgi:hypothetical protein
MRILVAAILMMTLGGCPSARTSDSALVAGLRGPMADLAGALVLDGGPKSKSAGRAVIAKFDAGAQ